MLAGCCAGLVGFLVFVTVLAAVSFGPVTLKISTVKLDELQNSLLPCDYCEDFVVDNGTNTSTCCTLDLKTPVCQGYEYCKGQKLSVQRTIENWKIVGIVGVVIDGLLLLFVVCLCLGNCHFCGCLSRCTKGCLKCFKGSCNWCFVGGRMFCALCPSFTWTARDERDNRTLLTDAHDEPNQRIPRNNGQRPRSQESRRGYQQRIERHRFETNIQEAEDAYSPPRMPPQARSQRQQKYLSTIRRLEREDLQEDIRTIYEQAFRQQPRNADNQHRPPQQQRQSTVCAICSWEIYVAERWRRLACGHRFHFDCIEEVFRTNNNENCPICGLRNQEHQPHHRFQSHR